MVRIKVKTSEHTEFVNITGMVRREIEKKGIEDGVCVVFVPHTTAGVTINENADPDVVSDLKYIFQKHTPWKDPHYKHFEGNTAAHFNASLVGSSVQIIINDGRLILGTWQGIFFAEFDGPRNREVWIKVLENDKKDNDI